MADEIKTTGAQNADADRDDPYADVKAELRTRFALLPEDVQKVLLDDGYQMKLFEIAKAQKLTYEELGLLEMETTMVLLGMTNPANYRDEIQSQLKKNDPEIDTLVKAVNEQVFTPLRASLEKVYAAKEAGEDTAAPSVKTETAPTGSLSGAEKTVLASTGVELAETQIQTPRPQNTMPSRSDILSAIENPPKAAAPSFVAQKLTNPGPVMPTIKTTDYSIPKPAPETPSAPNAPRHADDPYREPIE
jgi:hypothetical protein